MASMCAQNNGGAFIDLPHFSICNTFAKSLNEMLRKDPFDTLVQEMELGHTALGRGSEGWLEMKR